MSSNLELAVRQLINDLGKTLTLRKVTEGSYSPSTGSATNTTVDTTVKGLLLNYRDREMTNNDVIQAGDRKALLRASDSVVPELQDIILEGSTQYKILNVRQIEDAGTDVCYVCQVRK